MKNIIKKICSLLALIMIILNSSLLTTLSMAIDEINTNATANVSNGKKEKVKIYTSYTRLTNRLPNELTITGILEKDTEDCALYENPVVYFEFPAEIEKVVVNDIKVLYDNELKLKDYTIEKNDAGNQVIKVSLEGKQTQYSTDGISQGTNIRIVANVIAKQDIKTGYEDLTMVCNTATAAQGLLIVNSTENAILNNVEPKKENGTIIYANGLMLNTRSSIGSNTLKDGDTIHSNEIINNQITITNTTNNPIENIKVLGYIPEGMTFVKYDEEAFGYWEDTYTFLTDDPETSDGSILWQDDDWQYPADETVKTKEFTIETLKSGESQTFNYETKVNKVDKEKELETKIEFQIKDKDATEYRNISTYTIKNNAKDAAFETRIRTYIDRGDNSETGSSKNNWVYNVIVKNISNETQNATVKINVPETLSIKNVEKVVDKGEEFSYKLENGVLTVSYEGIAANDYRAFGIEAEAVNVITDENCRYQIEYSATVEDSNKDITSSNLSVSKGGIPAVKITQTSETNGETLNGHDEIEYKFEIENIGYVREEDGGYSEYVFVTNIPKELEVTSITYNSNEVSKDTVDSKTVYTIKPIDKWYTKEDLELINSDDYKEETRANEKIILKNGEKSIITIKAKVKSLTGQNDDITIENIGAVGGKGIETKVSSIVSNTLHNNENQTIIVNPDDKKDDNNSSTTKPSDDNTVEQVKYYTVAGTSWVDTNENGRRDDGEEIVSGINVYLYDVINKKFLTDSNNETLKTTTDSNGKYSFTKIPEGSYYVIFEYNTNEYGITEYQKVGILETENNDTLEKDVRMFGEIKKVAMTDIVNLTSSQTNIDIGLLENKNFDFSINQTVQKVTVSNKKGTKEYTYDNKKLAKVEIHSKQLAGSTIVVEYKIKVTNEGELAGRVYDVIDEIPSKLEFHSELNEGWYRTEQYKISNTSMVNKDIQPGESIELTVILSKTLTEDSVGTITNISSIGTTDNSRHITEKNLNNNTDKTEVLIQVATGKQIALRIIGIILGVLVLAFIMTIITRKTKFSKNIATNTFIVIAVLLMSTVITTYSNAGILEDAKNWVDDKVDKVTDWADKTFGSGSGSGNSGSNNNGTGSDIGTGDGNLDVDYSKPNQGLSKEEQEKIWMDELKSQYPGANYDGCNSLEECQERAKAQVQTDYVNAQLAQYGKSIPSGLTSTEAVEKALDEAKRGILSENYPGIDFSGVTSYEDALNRYNQKCEEQRNQINQTLQGSSAFKGANISGDMSNLDYNALKGLQDQLADIQNKYPENKTFRGDPSSQYTDEKGKIHYRRYLDENGNSVAYCGSPGKAQTAKKDLNYVRSQSDLKLTTDANGNATWSYDVTYKPTESYCGRDVQTMKASLGGSQSSKDLPEGSVPDVDLDKPPTYTPPDNPPDNPPPPTSNKTKLVIWKMDADTNEELWEKKDTSYISQFRFRIPGYAEDFGVGEYVEVDQNKTYTIYEIGSAFGYDIYEEDGSYKSFQVEVGSYVTSMDVRLNNIITKLKLSGNVWEDGLNGKDNARNDLYKDNDYDDHDKLLQGIKVRLYKDNELVGETWTDSNGHYSFGGRNADLSYTKDTLTVADLDKYHVEFEYNGMKYTNVNLHTDVANGSKAIEGNNNRQNYNNKFTTIASNTIKDDNGNSTGKALNEANSETGTLYYRTNQKYQSSIIYGDKSIYEGTSVSGKTGDFEAYGYDIYHITADTKVDEASYRYKLEDLFDWDVNNQVYKDKEIKNVNLGLYAREQVDVAIDSDVARFILNVNGYNHIYKYGTLISDNDMNVDANNVEQVDAKLKALKGKYYERQLHESSISYSATPEGTPNLYADITYKIYLQNKSNSLTAKIKELTLDYDNELNLISYGYENSGTTQEVSEQEIVANTVYGGTENLKEAVINLEKLEDKKISAGKKEVLEVTFRVYADTIARILNNPVGIKFDMMAEVSKYSTYTQQMTAYASIDKNSASRNEKVQIDTDNTFVTDTFENDTTIAPTFKLSKGTQTELSGIVYEDSPKESTPIKISGNNIYERVGDGIYNNENVMANVLVELLSVSMENGQYDSDTARTGENGKQEYDVAKLYQENKTTQGESSKVLARTYTNEKGEYKFEGLTAGNYVIKYTYGKNMKDVDENGQEKGTIRSATAIYTSDGKTKLKEIEAREYKSTVITSGEISNAMNITDGKAHLNGDYSWFLKSPETRYSDAVDDVEYRANLEKEAKINYEILKGTKTYVYENMEAYTPYFKLGVEEFNDQQSGATLETQEDGTLNYVFTIDNVDFGLIERPIVDLQVDKVITGLKVSLGNGQVLINGDPSKDSLPYVRTGLDDFVPIEMDTELLQNATIEEEYTIKITNNSELDYSIYPIWGTDNTQKVALRRNYYYYGTQEGLSTDEAVTARIDVLGDYIGAELTADESTMESGGWKKKAIEELTSYNGTNLFATENDGKKEKTLRDGKYTIYTTNTFYNPNEELVTIGKTKSISYKVSRLLAVNTDTMKYTNDIEILQYSGYSQNKNRTENTYNRVKDTTPGNLVPGGAKEDDEDSVRTTITPPTGTIISKWLYVLTATAGLILIGATVIFIRKRILLKK